MSTENQLKIDTQMLIRKPVPQVFEAFVDPEITTKFWFTKSSGKLALGKTVRWDWEMYDVSDSLTVIEFEQNRRICIDWFSDPSITEFRFDAVGKEQTLVTISSWNFPDSMDKALPMALDAKGGYTIVLAGLKAWLEHGIQLNLVGDQFPS